MIPDRQLITAKPFPATNCQTIQVWMLPVACVDMPMPLESSDFHVFAHPPSKLVLTWLLTLVAPPTHVTGGTRDMGPRAKVRKNSTTPLTSGSRMDGFGREAVLCCPLSFKG
jgi:hypothetical protein